MPPSKSPSSTSVSARSALIDWTSQPSWNTPGTSVRKRIWSAPMPTASADAASSAFTFSGPSASGETTGTSPAASARSTRGGAVGSGCPTRPSSGTCVRLRARSRRPRAATASGPIAAQTSAFTRGEAVAHDLEPLRRRHAPAVDELHLEAAPLHLVGDLRAGAVHDADRARRSRAGSRRRRPHRPSTRRRP